MYLLKNVVEYRRSCILYFINLIVYCLSEYQWKRTISYKIKCKFISRVEYCQNYLRRHYTGNSW